MKSDSILLILVLLIHAPLHGQSRFGLEPQKEAWIGAAAIGLALPGLLTEPEPNSRQPVTRINAIDRSLIYRYHRDMDRISTMTTYGMLILPVVAVLPQKNKLNSWLTYGVIYSEALLLTYNSKELSKQMLSRHRPYTYFDSPQIEITDESDQSFLSGHTAAAFMSATFVAQILSGDFSTSRWKKPVILTGFSLATVTGALRVRSGNHFFSDVVAGAAIGSFYGWLIPRLHRRNTEQRTGMSLYPTLSGLMIRFSI